MGKLDEIKNGAIDDGALDNVNGGMGLTRRDTVEEYLEDRDMWITQYNSAKAKPWTTQGYLNEILDTIKNIENELDSLGATYIPFNP